MLVEILLVPAGDQLLLHDFVENWQQLHHFLLLALGSPCEVYAHSIVEGLQHQLSILLAQYVKVDRVQHID